MITYSYMKHLRRLLIVFLLVSPFTSCKKVMSGRVAFDTDEVYFEQKGGCRTIQIVEGSIEHMDIYDMRGTDYSEFSGFEGDGETYLKKDWLELEKVVEGKTESLVITVSENTRGEPRQAKIYVAYLCGETSVTVRVYQE